MIVTESFHYVTASHTFAYESKPVVCQSLSPFPSFYPLSTLIYAAHLCVYCLALQAPSPNLEANMKIHTRYVAVTIFVSKGAHNGDFSSGVSASQFCTSEAGKAGLPGTWCALLEGESACPVPTALVLPGSAVEVEINRVDRDQYGDVFAGHFWTEKKNYRDCNGWTSSSSGDRAEYGRVNADGSVQNPIYNDQCSAALAIVCARSSGENARGRA